MTNPWPSRFNGRSSVVPTVVSRAVRLRRLAALAERGQCTEHSSHGVRCQRHKGHKGGCRTDLSFSEAEAIGLRPSWRGSWVPR